MFDERLCHKCDGQQDDDGFFRPLESKTQSFLTHNTIRTLFFPSVNSVTVACLTIA